MQDSLNITIPSTGYVTEDLWFSYQRLISPTPQTLPTSSPPMEESQGQCHEWLASLRWFHLNNRDKCCKYEVRKHPAQDMFPRTRSLVYIRERLLSPCGFDPQSELTAGMQKTSRMFGRDI